MISATEMRLASSHVHHPAMQSLLPTRRTQDDRSLKGGKPGATQLGTQPVLCRSKGEITTGLRNSNHEAYILWYIVATPCAFGHCRSLPASCTNRYPVLSSTRVLRNTIFPWLVELLLGS